MDLGSRNGTYVNEERVVTPVNLQEGTCIRVVNNTIVFVRIESAAADGGLAEATLGGSQAANAQSTRAAALLVCDVRGFSSIAETMPVAELAQSLGGWFREAGKIITDAGGSIDKFIGDAVLAYWSTASLETLDCDVSFKTALRLLDAASMRSWPDGCKFEVRVALHCGFVNCGNVGVDAQRDATIIGDAVNTVFRLESVMKELNQRVLASADFYDRLNSPSNLESLGERQLKGKRQKVAVFGVP